MAQTGITIGAALGAYGITASLGAGGMGQVWRAVDTKLDREAVLPIVFMTNWTQTLEDR